MIIQVYTGSTDIDGYLSIYIEMYLRIEKSRKLILHCQWINEEKNMR